MTASPHTDRYWLCDDSCTTDCGICKGAGRSPVDIPADVREDTVARAMYAEAMRRAVKHSRNSQAELRSAWNEAPDITRDWYLAVARAAISADPGPDTADQLRQRVHDACQTADDAHEADRRAGLAWGSAMVPVATVRAAVAGPRRDEALKCAWCYQKATGWADSAQGRVASCGQELHGDEGTYRRDEAAGR